MSQLEKIRSSGRMGYHTAADLAGARLSHSYRNKSVDLDAISKSDTQI